MRDLLSFLIARDTMQQNMWRAAAAELQEEGAEQLPVPSNFPQSKEYSKEYSEVAYQYLNFSDGTQAVDRREGRVHLPQRADDRGADAAAHPDSHLYGTTELPNPVEKVAGRVLDLLNRE